MVSEESDNCVDLKQNHNMQVFYLTSYSLMKGGIQREGVFLMNQRIVFLFRVLRKGQRSHLRLNSRNYLKKKPLALEDRLRHMSQLVATGEDDSGPDHGCVSSSLDTP